MLPARGIMFHHFHGGTHPTVQGSISADDLAQAIEFLGRDRILSAEDWSERAERGELAEGDICLTFDDSLRCQYELARPVLDAFGIRAFWFVYTSVMQGQLERLELYRHFRNVSFPSLRSYYASFKSAVRSSGVDLTRALDGFRPDQYLPEFSFYTAQDREFRFIRDDVLGPERYCEIMDAMLERSGYDVEDAARQLWMDDACLRELRRDGHVIGLHSHTHPTRLARMSGGAQREEYRANADHLVRVLGERPRSMSHPCNSYGPETLEILSELGVGLGFRANMAATSGGLLEFPREDHTSVLDQMRYARS